MYIFQPDSKSPYFFFYWCFSNVLSFFLAGKLIILIKDNFVFTDATPLIFTFSIFIAVFNIFTIFRYTSFNQKILWFLSDFLSYSALIYTLSILYTIVGVIKDSSQNIYLFILLLQNPIFWVIIVSIFLIWMVFSYLQVVSGIFMQRKKTWAIYNSLSFLSILLFLTLVLEMVQSNTALLLLTLFFSITLKSIITYLGLRYCCFYRR
jgi:hypothetical protein